LVGLLPTKRGPRGAHKITAEVLRYIEDLRANDPDREAQTLTEDIAAHFGLAVHRRTVERALARSKKKRP
jgi:transposase